MRSVTAHWILPDQLLHDHPALALAGAGDVFVLLESREQLRQGRPHTHKLVLLLSALRHFAAELRAAGRPVVHRSLSSGEDYESAWQAVLREHPVAAITVMAPADYDTAAGLPDLARRLDRPVQVLPDRAFLVSREDFAAWAAGRAHPLMAHHYQFQRRRLGLLLDPDGGPLGGRWSYDPENRLNHAAFRRQRVVVPPLGGVEPDEVTRQVMDEVAALFPDHAGDPHSFRLPVCRREALAWLSRFIAERLAGFGPWEDLMDDRQTTLFHSLLTPMLNAGLLRPHECVEAAVAALEQGRAPLASVEGFVRQIIGWREFINGIYWLRMPDYRTGNGLAAHRGLPRWAYDGDTPMRCLHRCISQARDTGFNHHIQRLMVLGNFFLLGGYDPQAVVRWYMEMYVDAYDWVMQPNVLGMALHADGGFFATKPYAAGSGYISKMSDYCTGCRYRPAVKSGPQACPFNYLYWAFLDRHAERFRDNPRMAMPLRTLARMPEAEKERIRREAGEFLDAQA